MFYRKLRSKGFNDIDFDFQENTFQHFNGLDLDSTSEVQKVIRHRLYISCPDNLIYKNANLIFDKFEENNLDFYFKCSATGNMGRKDNIVIYCTNENFNKTFHLLQEIMQNNRENFKYGYPLLCGGIDGWIGYGSEFEKGNTSYNSEVSKNIESILANLIADRVTASLDREIVIPKDETIGEYSLVKAGEKIRIASYIARYLTLNEINDMKQILNGRKAQFLLNSDKVEYKKYIEGRLETSFEDIQKIDTLEFRTKLYNKYKETIKTNGLKSIYPTFGNKYINLNFKTISKIIFDKSDYDAIAEQLENELKNIKSFGDEKMSSTNLCLTSKAKMGLIYEDLRVNYSNNSKDNLYKLMDKLKEKMEDKEYITTILNYMNVLYAGSVYETYIAIMAESILNKDDVSYENYKNLLEANIINDKNEFIEEQYDSNKIGKK